MPIHLGIASTHIHKHTVDPTDKPLPVGPTGLSTPRAMADQPDSDVRMRDLPAHDDRDLSQRFEVLTIPTSTSPAQSQLANPISLFEPAPDFVSASAPPHPTAPLPLLQPLGSESVHANTPAISPSWSRRGLRRKEKVDYTNAYKGFAIENTTNFHPLLKNDPSLAKGLKDKIAQNSSGRSSITILDRTAGTPAAENNITKIAFFQITKGMTMMTMTTTTTIRMSPSP